MDGWMANVHANTNIFVIKTQIARYRHKTAVHTPVDDVKFSAVSSQFSGIFPILSRPSRPSHSLPSPLQRHTQKKTKIKKESEKGSEREREEAEGLEL